MYKKKLKKNKKKIFICATEQSGDNIGMEILKEIIKKRKNFIIDGVGGTKMKPYMAHQFYNLKDFKSIGIIEIIFSLKKYIGMMKRLKEIITIKNYDLIITIDSPDFNYPLCKKIKKLGYKNKIIHIVAPTVWAWRKNRAKKFANIFDHLFTLFKFENKFFEKYNLTTTCIGHPIFFIKKIKNSNSNKNFIAFLPGSRLGEVQSLFKYYELAYKEILQKNIKLNIFIPTLPHLHKEILLRTKHWKIKTIVEINEKLIKKFFLKTKYALVCSGTASLEIAKMGIPQLVIYKLNIFTEIIASFFVNVKYANIINIIENKMIIPELVNSKLNNIDFLKNYNNLLFDNKSNKKQVLNVSKVINKIQKNKSPFKIASEKILKVL